MSTLRELPKRRNAVQPSSMRWLKHIHDVYNELDATLLKRPDVIEAYNRLYDEVEKYKYAFLMDYPNKLIYYLSGIVPVRYNTRQIHTILQSSGESYTENEIEQFYREYQVNIPYYLRRRSHIYPNGTIRLAGMIHEVLHPGDIIRRLDLATLEGTPYATDLTRVLSELTELYIVLYNRVKDVIEPVILKKWAAACQKAHVARLQKTIERKNGERIRLERKYKDSLKEIEESLDRMYAEMDRWIKKENKE